MTMWATLKSSYTRFLIGPNANIIEIPTAINI